MESMRVQLKSYTVSEVKTHVLPIVDVDSLDSSFVWQKLQIQGMNRSV